MKLLLFPDFVAYPMCYLRFVGTLPPGVSAEALDYNAFWPYASIEQLARAIADVHGEGKPDALVGYSFGALVAAAAAPMFTQHGARPRLYLLDPPDLAAPRPDGAVATEARLRADSAYNYIFDLIDCGLTAPDCVLGNVGMLGQVATPIGIDLPCTMYLAGAPLASLSPARQFALNHEDSVVTCIGGYSHATLVQCAAIFEHICLPGRACPGMPLAGADAE